MGLFSTAAKSIMPGEWDYAQQIDEMRGKITKTASLHAEDLIHFGFPYGDETATLIVRNSPVHGKDVLLAISNGQFMCDMDGSSVTVKFDDKKPTLFATNGPSDHSSTIIFIQNYTKFVSELEKSNQLIIEAEFYQEGHRQIKFNTQGFDPAQLK